MFIFFFFFKQKTAYEISACLVGSEMWLRDSPGDAARKQPDNETARLRAYHLSELVFCLFRSKTSKHGAVHYRHINESRLGYSIDVSHIHI